jgi:hypothetical protein
MQFPIIASFVALWSLIHQYNIITSVAISDISWYFESPTATIWMHEAQCTVPSLHCIREAKKTAAAVHSRLAEQANCERNERIKIAEQERLRLEQEKKDWDFVVKKAALYDKLSAEDFTINVVENNFHHHHGNIHVYNQYNTFVSEGCPTADSEELSRADLAKHTITELHHKYYDTSSETDLQRASDDFDTENVVKKFLWHFAFCLLAYAVLEIFLFLKYWVLGRIWGENVIELGEI